MNKKLQRVMTAGLAVLVGSGLFVTSVDAASLTKSLKAIYNNIKVTYDGQSVTPNMEPFMVDGTVYVSLRDAGQITGNAVDWKNNTVHITPGAGTVDQGALDAKQREVDFWKTKADALEKQLNELKEQGNNNNNNGGTVVKPGDTTAMEKKLVELFDEERNVAWDFSLKQHPSKDILYVTVSYDGKTDRRDFENITDSKLTTFLKDVCFEIRQAFPNLVLEGTLEDSYKDNVIGNFTYSLKNSLSYTKTLTDADIREIRNELASKYKALPSLPLGDSTNTVLKVENFDLSVRDDEVTYKLYVPKLTDSQIAAWNKLNAYDAEDLLYYFLDDIEYDIHDEMSYDSITGYIYSDNKIIAIYEDQYFTKKNIY